MKQLMIVKIQLPYQIDEIQDFVTDISQDYTSTKKKREKGDQNMGDINHKDDLMFSAQLHFLAYRVTNSLFAAN